MVPEVIVRLILILSTLLASLGATGDAQGQTPADARLYVYDVEGELVVRTTPQPGVTPVEVLTPTRKLTAHTTPIPLARAAPYLELAITQAHAHGLEPALVLGVIEAESHFDPRAVSHAGAVGMMQLMPVHWSKLEGQNPYDPSENVRVGCEYLARLLKVHHGDLHRALAAYNAGSGTVRRLGGPPRFTLGYVSRIIRARARWREHLKTGTPRLTEDAYGRHLRKGGGQ